MTFGIGNLVALICIVISIIFAIITHQATNALWWALLAIFAVLWWDARAPWVGHKGQPTPSAFFSLSRDPAAWRAYRRHNTRLTATTVSARAANTPPNQP